MSDDAASVFLGASSVPLCVVTAAVELVSVFFLELSTSITVVVSPAVVSVDLLSVAVVVPMLDLETALVTGLVGESAAM